MTNKIIVDTSIIVGTYDEQDCWYKQAKELMEKFKELSLDLVLLDCVANETFTVLARRLHERKNQKLLAPTLKRVKSAFSKDKITMAYTLLENNYEEVIDTVIAHNGKLNFHDALIVTFALKHKISLVASFDKDFDDIHGITRIFKPGNI